MFAVGADYFGVAELSGFGADTHKFESRYDDWLVGSLPEAKGCGASARRSTTPTASGAGDRPPGAGGPVVPPSQSEKIVAALDRNGVPHEYLVFEGEQHGFRKAETMRRAIEAEFSFYAQVLGFEPADEVEPVELMR